MDEFRHNIWDDRDEVVDKDKPDTVYIPLNTIISFDGFLYLSHGSQSYLVQEKELLQPQLEALGYTDVEWFEGETDSFGPLTRRCKAKDPTGETVWFIYG